MKKQLIFIFVGLAVRHHPTVHTEKGTLILVGATKSSIVLAADSLVLDTQPGKRPAATNKIIPISQYAVCFVTGDSTIRWVQDAKTTDEVNPVEVVKDWTRAHPKAQLSDAYHSLDTILLDALKGYHRKHPISVDTHSFSSFGCVGYNMGAPTIYNSDYVAATTQDITKRDFNSRLFPGFFVPLGKDAVCLEITRGGASEHFHKAKSNPAVVKYKKAVASGDTSAITESDLLAISRVCLAATEGHEGRTVDSGAAGVGPPNRYAVIDEHKGFRWVAAQ